MTKKILVVDDAKTIRDLVRFSLSKQGYSVVEASDGLEAIKALEANGSVDLIISDLNMPNMNGLELSQKVKQSDSWKQIPIFMLTTEASQEIAQKGKQIGILAWIVKPFQPDKLLAAIHKVLGA